MSSPKASPAPAKSAKKRAGGATVKSGTYASQIVDAIKHFGIRGGVSSAKIKQYIEENAEHPIQKGVLNRAIKKAVEAGMIAPKAGHANTFHVVSKSSSAKASPKAKASTGVAAKKGKKSPTAKKASTKKAAASPKSPKSPAAKSPSSKKKSAAPKKKAAAASSSSKKKAGATKKASTKKTATKKAGTKKASTKKTAKK